MEPYLVYDHECGLLNVPWIWSKSYYLKIQRDWFRLAERSESALAIVCSLAFNCKDVVNAVLWYLATFAKSELKSVVSDVSLFNLLQTTLKAWDLIKETTIPTVGPTSIFDILVHQWCSFEVFMPPLLCAEHEYSKTGAELTIVDLPGSSEQREDSFFSTHVILGQCTSRMHRRKDMLNRTQIWELPLNGVKKFHWLSRNPSAVVVQHEKKILAVETHATPPDIEGIYIVLRAANGNYICLFYILSRKLLDTIPVDSVLPKIDRLVTDPLYSVWEESSCFVSYYDVFSNLNITEMLHLWEDLMNARRVVTYLSLTSSSYTVQTLQSSAYVLDSIQKSRKADFRSPDGSQIYKMKLSLCSTARKNLLFMFVIRAIIRNIHGSPRLTSIRLSLPPISGGRNQDPKTSRVCKVIHPFGVFHWYFLVSGCNLGNSQTFVLRDDHWPQHAYHSFWKAPIRSSRKGTCLCDGARSSRFYEGWQHGPWSVNRDRCHSAVLSSRCQSLRTDWLIKWREAHWKGDVLRFGDIFTFFMKIMSEGEESEILQVREVEVVP